MKADMNVRFSDIAGYATEKKEAMKIADVLARFDVYRAKGASVPKGLILSGEPGVGKTMFAKAIASEADVPLFELGVKSSNEKGACEAIESAFSAAKASAPSILFIDEIDEIIPSENLFSYFKSDATQGVLKTLLGELDGGCASEGVLVIATTNDMESVPTALVRSGRLERHITLNAPSFEDRKEIIELYLRKKGIEGIDTSSLAGRTNGFTGADLKTLVNEALLNSVREGREPLLSDFEERIPIIRFGNVKNEAIFQPSPSVAWHEIGHFLCRYALTGELSTISVESYGNVRGYVVSEEETNQDSRTRESDVDKLLDLVTVCLGGIAGEEVFLGKRYCGSGDDISKALKTITLILSNGALGFGYLPEFPMQQRVNGRLLEGWGNGMLYQQKIVDILEEKLQVAISIVRERKELGEAIFPLLIEKGTMRKEDLQKVLERLRPLGEEPPKSIEGNAPYNYNSNAQ